MQPPPHVLSSRPSSLPVTLLTFSNPLFSALQWLQEEAVYLPGPADGIHEPPAARLPTERGAVPPAEARAGPTDHGEIRDQHQPAGPRLVSHLHPEPMGISFVENVIQHLVPLPLFDPRTSLVCREVHQPAVSSNSLSPVARFISSSSVQIIIGS